MKSHLTKTFAAVATGATLTLIGATLFLFSSDAPTVDTNDPNLSVENRTLVSQKRVSRTETEHTYTGERITVADEQLTLVVPEGFTLTEGQDSSGEIRYVSIRDSDLPTADDSNPHPAPALTIRIIANEREGIIRTKESYLPPPGSPNASTHSENIEGRDYLVVTEYLDGEIDRTVYMTDFDDQHFLQVYGESSDGGQKEPTISDTYIRYILATMEFNF